MNLNENKIKGLAAPSEDKDGANKKYVDDEIAKLPHSDTGTLKLDGSRAMTGTLDMNNNKIKGLADPTDLTDVANKKYVDDQIKTIPAVDTSDFLKLDGSRSVTGNLLLAGNSINGLKDPNPSNSNYAATVNFVNKMVSDNNTTISTLIDSKITEVDYLNIKAAKQENVFFFVIDDDLFKEDDSDITKIGKVDKDFYDLQKETYQFNINYDGNIGYYSTRTGIGLKAIDLGEYTLVFEMYFNETKIDKK